MNGLIEIAVAALIIATIFCHSAARNWLAEIGSFNRRCAIGLLALMMAGQVVNESRKLFPFVRWSMYTEICENDHVAVGKFQALHANGETSWINPTVCYPSLARNNHERVQLVMMKLQDGELSAHVSQLFDQYMLALGKRCSANNLSNPVVEIRAVLQQVTTRGDQVRKTDQIVHKIVLENGHAVGFVRVGR